MSAIDFMRDINEWNRKYPIGTEVVVSPPSGGRFRKRTRTIASLFNGRDAIVVLEGSSHRYPLKWIKPIRERW